MNEYVKPDYTVMEFESNEYVSACYIMDGSSSSSETAGSFGWCQASDSEYFYDMNGTLDMTDDGDWWQHDTPANGCNGGSYGSGSYQIVAKDLIQIEVAGQKYWANAYKGNSDGTQPDSYGGHNLFISFLKDGFKHLMGSGSFNGNVDQTTGGGYWTNHS